VSFEKSEEAMRAFSQVDNKILFGRIVHVKPAMEDVGSLIKNAKEAEFEQNVKEKYGDNLDEKSSYKKQKKR
jgi:multiple RNA-binding domain-containing protein 1